MRGASARLDRFNRQKRIIDTVIVALALPVLLPLMIATGLLAWFSMGRPVLYRQTRAGLNERPFEIIKFRTMSDKRSRDGLLLPDQDRITPVGRFIRNTSLDELPQLVNVLRGDMALVGPRPLFVEYLPYYRERETMRHWVRPGITGLAQTAGRNTLQWNDRLALDAKYVEESNLLLDFRVLVRTVLRVLNSSGVAAIPNEHGERLDVLRSYPVRDGYTIRRFEFSDIPHRVRLFNDSAIRRYMTLPGGITQESTELWLRESRKDPSKRDFTVVTSDTGEPVGLLGLRERPVPGIPEMYILVDPCHQGKGVGRTALLLLMDWMREQSRYRGCWLTVDADNQVARSLYEKLGFRIIDPGSADPLRLEMELCWGGMDA